MANNPTVLVVNDDPVQLRLTAAALGRDGFAVLSCADAEQALRLLGEARPVDVVVTDLYMPGIDGWRLCRLLRSAAFARFNRTPILVVSSIFSGADAEELTAQLGADGFLAAPYDAIKLCRVVRGLIGNQRPVASRTVLIVEPDGGHGQQLAAAFEAASYQVSLARDGQEALTLFRQKPRQILVLDGDFAEVRTDRLLDAIKEPGTPTVVMVLTSDSSASVAVELIRKGADNYLRKPFAAEYLVKLCEAAVRQRALLRIEELLQIRTRRLRESEDRYRSLFENAGDGIVTYTLDGVMMSVNRALETLLAAGRDDLLGDFYGKYLTAASLLEAKLKQDEARHQRHESWMCELELLRPDAVVVPVQAHCRFLGAKDGEPAIVMATYRDLTAARKLERQRAEFTAMLAHDIRNPVGLIRGYAELLLYDSDRPLDAARKHQCYERIRDAAEVVDSLVNNYLDLSRIEAGQLELAKLPVDLAALLRRIFERFEGDAQRRRTRFELRAAQGPVGIDGDMLALDRVFANLLNNAFKFTPPGGAIALSMIRRGAEVVVEVRDSGPGIDAATLPLLFQKFNRVEIAERQEGLGLGLFIVRELVHAHGGRVEVASAPGAGACFAVFLPLAAGAGESSAQSADARRKSAAGNHQSGESGMVYGGFSDDGASDSK